MNAPNKHYAYPGMKNLLDGLSLLLSDGLLAGCAGEFQLKGSGSSTAFDPPPDPTNIQESIDSNEPTNGYGRSERGSAANNSMPPWQLLRKR